MNKPDPFICASRRPCPWRSWPAPAAACPWSQPHHYYQQPTAASCGAGPTPGPTPGPTLTRLTPTNCIHVYTGSFNQKKKETRPGGSAMEQTLRTTYSENMSLVCCTKAGVCSTPAGYPHRPNDQRGQHGQNATMKKKRTTHPTLTKFQQGDPAACRSEAAQRPP